MRERERERATGKWSGYSMEGGGEWEEKIRGWGEEGERISTRKRERRQLLTKLRKGIVYRYKPANQKLTSPLPHMHSCATCIPVLEIICVAVGVTIELD